MFKFNLMKPNEITPWGDENNLTLHWFGLTYSYYWLDFCKVELLRYSDAFIDYYQLNQDSPYVDYQFARIFWDFTEIVRSVLEPIPDEIFNKIRTEADLKSYLDTLQTWLEHSWNENEEDYDNNYLPARAWIDNRRLDSGYLIGAPDIYFFRNNNKVYIRWKAEYMDQNGISMWAATRGEIVLDYELFISELLSSINEFAFAMEGQVQTILKNPFEDVHIDLDRLLENHKEFLATVSTYNGLATLRTEQTDWKEVRTKMSRFTEK